MKVRKKLVGAGLLVLLAAGLAGMYLTSRPVAPASSKTASGLSGASASLNPHYLNAAIALALQAATPEEQRAAQNALNDADHDLDLQYAYALQLAAITPVPETPQIRALQHQISKINNIIETRQTEVKQLESLLPRLHGARKVALERQLDVRRAELGLSHEALSDANDSLDRAGGSLEGRLAKLKADHVAMSQERDTFKFPALPGSAASGGLLAKWSHWRTVYSQRSQIQRAQQEADAAALDLMNEHDVLLKRIATEDAQQTSEERELTPNQTATLPSLSKARPDGNPNALPVVSAPALLAQKNVPTSLIALIQRISSDRLMARIVSRRIDAMKDLGSAYVNWNSLLGASERSAAHRLIAVGLWIVVIMACAFFLNRLIEHLFAGLSLERKQRKTLEAVLRISVRLIAVIVALMVIFGKPSNLSTVLGLAGAGLAVALQSFILSILGWFVLMGRHGIRVGDWVEINQNAFTGVRGEVIEITLFRTVLLETGNSNEPSHLTGRKVAFMNMYAVTGYYFNFSTSGQWLWDELEIAIPRGQDPYPLAEKIRTTVAGATEDHAQLAEREWQRVSDRYGTRPASAQPTVNIRPSDNGAVAIVRYIARADERGATRYRLNHEIVKLLQNGEELVFGNGVVSGAEASEPHG
jgi:small-conductance mechanosensitive channel